MDVRISKDTHVHFAEVADKSSRDITITPDIIPNRFSNEVVGSSANTESHSKEDFHTHQTEPELREIVVGKVLIGGFL